MVDHGLTMQPYVLSKWGILVPLFCILYFEIVIIKLGLNKNPFFFLFFFLCDFSRFSLAFWKTSNVTPEVVGLPSNVETFKPKSKNSQQSQFFRLEVEWNFLLF
jgi:hypothetical protein